MFIFLNSYFNSSFSSAVTGTLYFLLNPSIKSSTIVELLIQYFFSNLPTLTNDSGQSWGDEFDVASVITEVFLSNPSIWDWKVLRNLGFTSPQQFSPNKLSISSTIIIDNLFFLALVYASTISLFILSRSHWRLITGQLKIFENSLHIKVLPFPGSP